MERGLQKVNQRSRLEEWGRRVEACRNSGQRVSEWCVEYGIPVSTYYSWQRKVFQAVSSENEVCFAEIPVKPIGTDIAGSIQYGDLQVNIHAGADAETIQAIIRALKSCWAISNAAVQYTWPADTQTCGEGSTGWQG